MAAGNAPDVEDLFVLDDITGFFFAGRSSSESLRVRSTCAETVRMSTSIVPHMIATIHTEVSMWVVVDVGSANSCVPVNDWGAEITSGMHKESATCCVNGADKTRTDVIGDDLHVAEALARCVQILCVVAQHVRTPRAVLVQLDLIDVRR